MYKVQHLGIGTVKGTYVLVAKFVCGLYKMCIPMYVAVTCLGYRKEGQRGLST